MDKNTLIGMSLIAILLVCYFSYFSPQPKPAEEPTATAQQAPKQSTPASIPTAAATQAALALADSAYAAPQTLEIENSDIAVSLSSRGGVIESVRLKGFKGRAATPLYLIKDGSSTFSLAASRGGQPVDLYTLPYTAETQRRGDTTVVRFIARIVGGGSIQQQYTLPPSGYEVGYRLIEQEAGLNGEAVTLRWIDRVRLQEKHMEDCRKTATINYYTTADRFDGLRSQSSEEESEQLSGPVKWVAIKDKFFLGALIAEKVFSGGSVTLSVDPADTIAVKLAQAELRIPRAELTGSGVALKYFFGPLQHDALQEVAPDFVKNLNLGWPPIVWVNEFVIIPIFKFLERYMGSYGLIIVVMVLIIKLILSPLSYKSYLGMAKMRILKPELDLVREKYGDDMTKAQQEQLKLYQQAGVSPVSGCVPLLLQMPILFSMFYFFPVSIELRQARFLWADDLSTYDAIVRLPFSIPFYGDHVSLFVLLMTASTLIYTWQNNQISSVQGPMKSFSYIMPLIFLFVLNSFSAGLSFYYFVSNLITFSQQAIIRRFVDEDKLKQIMEDHRKKIAASGGSPTRSKFMNKLQEAMKASEEKRRQSKK